MVVVPRDVESGFLSHLVSARWNGHDPAELVFQRQDEPLDNGDAAVFANRSETRFDTGFETPRQIRMLVFVLRLDVFARMELASLIANDVLGLFPNFPRRSLQDLDDILGARLLFEQSESDRFS